MMKIHESKPERERHGSCSEAGFTLIEILLVVVIIGILAAVVIPRLGGRVEESNIAATQASIANLRIAVSLYELDVGQYPSSLGDLVNEPGEQGWKGPYIEKGEVPKDAWGHDFIYSASGNGYELKSPGRDGVSGGEDDVTD